MSETGNHREKGSQTENSFQGKRVSDSQITLNQLMLPQHANPMGNIHGGVIMKLVDEAGALCAIRHSRRMVVTRTIDSMSFHSPVQVGDLLTLKASLNWVGRSSMEVGIRVMAENLLTGKSIHTNTAFIVYVALDKTDQGTAIVPPLILETEEDRRRWDEAEARQQRRLER